MTFFDVVGRAKHLFSWRNFSKITYGYYGKENFKLYLINTRIVFFISTRNGGKTE